MSVTMLRSKRKLIKDSSSDEDDKLPAKKVRKSKTNLKAKKLIVKGEFNGKNVRVFFSASLALISSWGR